MFYKMIETKRNEWLASETCTVKAVIDYIVKTGQMRDAQVEAIRTYLFLKIACGCKPLAELFCEGAFNTLDLDDSADSLRQRLLYMAFYRTALIAELIRFWRQPASPALADIVYCAVAAGFKPIVTSTLNSI